MGWSIGHPFGGGGPSLGQVADPFNVVGGVKDAYNQFTGKTQQDAIDRANQQNIQMQEEFAKNGIKWKIDDAAARGISPLAAIGAAGTTFSPSVLPDVTGPSPAISLAANMGQDILRAKMATLSAPERAYVAQKQAIDVAKDKAQLDLLTLQLDKMRAGQLGPGVPKQDWEYMVDESGQRYKTPSLDWVERNRTLPFSGWGWMIRNNMIPASQVPNDYLRGFGYRGPHGEFDYKRVFDK